MSLVFILLDLFFLTIVYYSGQFIAALAFRMHHHHYFLGFNPRLFDVKLFGLKLSFGFYIPIVGLSRIYKVENGEKQRTSYPWEFFDQPIWKRLLVTSGGILSMVVSGVLIFIAIAYFGKESYITKDEVNKHGIYPSDLALQYGFERGDKIIAINGKAYENYVDLINPDVYQTEGSSSTVLRNRETLEIKITGHSRNRQNRPFLALLAPFEIESIAPQSAAAEAGLMPGDRITKVNGHPIIKIYDLQDEFAKDEDGEVTLEIQRQGNNNLAKFETIVHADPQKRIGIIPHELITYTVKENTLVQSIIKGTSRAFITLIQQTNGFLRVMSGKLLTAGGPVGISAAYGNDADWFRFWNLTGIFAMLAAFWNILPFPRSAFWEIIPLAYEGISGKQFSLQWFYGTRKWAYTIIILLMAWVFLIDIIRLF